MKFTEEEIKERRRCAEQARLIAISNDGNDISDYAKELKERWVIGEITMEERRELLINHYKRSD